MKSSRLAIAIFLKSCEFLLGMNQVNVMEISMCAKFLINDHKVFLLLRAAVNKNVSWRKIVSGFI